MCIIAAKPAGVAMPDRDTIRTMWENNPDGAGLMYPYKGQIRIEKGFMKYKAFAKVLDRLEAELDLTALSVVMHFRITTHGGTKPENCHPFPITDNVIALGKPVCNTAIGVAHNGIIDIRPRKGISDTMEYVASQLAPLHRALPRFYENKHAMQLIANAIDSKMAFLTKGGKIFTIGEFVEDKGVLYSNDSFDKAYSRFRFGTFSSFGGLLDAPCLDDFARDPWADANGYKPLQWLDEYDYVSLPDGVLDAGLDYLIDEENQVWFYDMERDFAIALPGATAYSASGVLKQFDEDSPDIMTTPVYME